MRQCALFLIPLLLAACSQQIRAPITSGSHLLGYVQVTAGENTALSWVQPSPTGLGPLALGEVPEGLDLRAVTTLTPVLNTADTRYLYATLLVRNGRSGYATPTTARRNLTFLAVDTPAPLPIRPSPASAATPEPSSTVLKWHAASCRPTAC